MIKYTNTQIVLSEIPDEITLAINISGCPNNCIGCHSSYLLQDIGEELNNLILMDLISASEGITCVAFMGGDRSPEDISSLAYFIKSYYNNTIKVAWYSGKTSTKWFSEYAKKSEILPNEPWVPVDNRWFDYIKLGPYIEEFGPLNKKTTNQRMYKNTGLSSSTHRLIGWEDITYKFWKNGKDGE